MTQKWKLLRTAEREKTDTQYFTKQYFKGKRAARRSTRADDTSSTLFPQTGLQRSAKNLSAANFAGGDDRSRGKESMLSMLSSRQHKSSNSLIKLPPPSRNIMPVLEQFFPDPKAYKKIPLTTMSPVQSPTKETKHYHSWGSKLKLKPEPFNPKTAAPSIENIPNSE